MDIDLRIQGWYRDALQLVQEISPETAYNVWLGSGVLLAVLWAWWGYNTMRKACGHIRFRGTWYNAEQAEELLQMIDEDCKRGARVMRHDEMALLRRWRFGDSKPMFNHNPSSYF